MPSAAGAYTQGSIAKAMLKTAVAMLAGTLAMSGYNIADTYFVGQLPGATPLAAMGFSFPVIMLLGCVFHGMGAGIMALSAQSVGGNRRKKASGVVSGGLLLVALVSVFLAVAGIASLKMVFGRLGAQGEALVAVEEYMQIWYFGCFTASLSMAANDILIATGKAKIAGLIMMSGMILNVILDPLFIFGKCGLPPMGIRGAALATIGSQLAVTAAGLFLLSNRYRLLRWEIIPLRHLKQIWRSVLRYAVPASIGMLMMPIGSAVITRITADFGDTAIAAVAASGRLEMVAFVFPMSLGMSLMPMIGQNYGARLYSRIRSCFRFSVDFAFFFLTAMALVYFFAADHMVVWFSSDPEVRRIMALAMRIIPWGFAAIEIHRYCGFFYTACGRPTASAWLNALRIMGLMVPLSFLALFFHSLPGLFFARLAADLGAAAVGWLLVRRLIANLPEDGMPNPPPPHAAWRLKAFIPWQHTHAQNDIDSRSSTQ